MRQERGDSGRPPASAASDSVCPRGSAPHAPGIPQPSRFPRRTAPAARNNHDDVTSWWSGPLRSHIVVVARGQRPVTGEASAPAGGARHPAAARAQASHHVARLKGPGPTWPAMALAARCPGPGRRCGKLGQVVQRVGEMLRAERSLSSHLGPPAGAEGRRSRHAEDAARRNSPVAWAEPAPVPPLPDGFSMDKPAVMLWIPVASAAGDAPADYGERGIPLMMW